MLASSRGTLRRRKARGRDLRPKSRRCAAVGLRNAPAGGINPAPTNKFCALGQPGRPWPRVRTNPCRGRFHIGPVCGGANAPRADMESAPTNGGKARGQPGKCEPRDATNLCRRRCSHRPGGPCAAARFAGGPWPSPTTAANARPSGNPQSPRHHSYPRKPSTFFRAARRAAVHHI